MSSIDKTILFFRIDLLNKLKEIGYKTYVACGETNSEFGQEIENQGHHFEKLSIEKSANPINLLKGMFEIYRFLKKEKIEVIHTHTPLGGFMGRIAARIAGIKCVLHTTGGWYFHENMSWWKRKIFINAEKYLARLTDYIFSVNKEDIQTARKYNISPRKEIIYSGPAGVDSLKFSNSFNSNQIKQLKQKLKISSNTGVIGFVGRLVPEKGIMEFLNVIKLVETKNPDYKLCGIIVGEGPARQKLEKFIVQKKIKSNILFLGHRSDISLLMKLFDVYLFPSYREGVPISVLEAMATERNVVAFDIRGCREAIVNGQSGTIVPFKDLELMSDAVIRYLSQEVNHGKQARERIISNYSRTAHVESQIPVYQKIQKKYSI